MNCFNHPDIPAVGMCKVCQKGLCKGCAFDLGHGISCKDHRQQAEILNSTSGIYTQMSFVFMPIGIIMILSEFSMEIFMGTKEPIFPFIGTGLLFFGSFFLILGSILRLRKPQNKKSQKSLHQ